MIVLLEVFLKINDKFETFVVQMNELKSYQIASLNEMKFENSGS